MGVSFDLERSEQKASVDDQNGGGGRGGRKWTILSPRRLPNGAYTLFTLVAIVILFFGPVSLYKTTLSLAPLPSGPSPASPELITDAPLVQLHNSKEAYVTFLSEVSKDPWYGINTRLLLFQFKHDPLTYDPTRDFIVLTTPHIPLAVEDQLRAEGAIVIRKELILNMPGQHDANGSHVWKDQYTKLHAFNLTQYERVLFLDNDMMISKPLDEIWDDPGSWPDAGLASTSQNGADHPHPPENTYHEFNGGFWMARPDEELFKTLLQVKGYDTWAQEQSLLNHYFRLDGPHAWVPLDHKYSTMYPCGDDIRGGVHALHEKFWHAEWKDHIDRPLTEFWRQKLGRMEGYWLAKTGAQQIAIPVA